MKMNQPKSMNSRRLASAVFLGALVVATAAWSFSARARTAEPAGSKFGFASPAGSDQPGLEELDKRLETFRARKAVKESIVAGLASGEMSLRQAVEYFGYMHESDQGFWTYARSVYPGDTDEERLYHNVVDYTTAVMRGREGAEAVIDRLWGELRADLRQPASNPA
jgi:hypothetical protein